MINFGKVDAGSTLYIPFSTYGTTGASITLTGLAVTDIEIYKDGSTTQRASDAGYSLLDTDGVDFDGITGIHGFSIDLSDNTDSGFYASGSQYWVVVSAVTVDSLTVNFIAATFQIGVVSANVVQIGGNTQSATDLKDFADTGYDPSTHKVQGVVLTDTLTTYTGNTPQTGDAYARLGAPAGASVSADVAAVKAQTAAIETDTQDLQTQVGTAGAGLTAVPWNASWDAEVQSECADALAAYDPPTNAEMEARTILSANYALEATLTSMKGATFDTATDSLEAIRNRGDSAWTTATGFSTHSASDVWAVGTRVLTAGTNIVLAKGTGVTGFNDLSAAQVNAEVDTAISDVGLTTTVTGRIDTAISTRLASADYTAPDNSTINTIAGYVDTEIPAIKAKTDLIPASPASVSDIPTATENADALLKRDMSAVTGEATRSPLNALRRIRNKTEISGSNLITYKEDDTTAAWQAAITTDADADPITAVDPA